LLAKKYGAKVELFECCYSRSLVSSHLFDQSSADLAKHSYLRGEEKRLQRVADQLTEAGVEVATDVAWEVDTESGYLTKIDRFRPDLVVKSCSYHHRIAAFLFGNLDWQMIRHCPVPLLLMRPQRWSRSPVVVTSLDPLQEKQHPARLDDQVLRAGESLVAHIGGVLHLFHSYQTLPSSVVFDDTVMLNYEQLRNHLSEQHRQAMADLLTGHGLAQAEPTVHLAHGEVHKELPSYATEVVADLVVLGGMERSGADRLFLGSTTEKVLDRIEADVLVVRAGD
jgi:universal stress protein E